MHWKDICRETNGPDVCDGTGCKRCIEEAARIMTERVLEGDKKEQSDG